MRSLKTYSDAGCTTQAEEFEIGDTVYIDGSICALVATDGSTVKLEVFDENDQLIGTPLNDTDHDFPANTVQTIKTNVNGGTAPNFTLTKGTYFHLRYYIKLTVSGSDLDNLYDETEFIIPLADITALDIFATENDDSTKKEYWENGETLHINGSVTLDQAVDDAELTVKLISVTNGTVTILNAVTANLAKDTPTTLKAMNANTSITRELTEDDEYFKLSVLIAKSDYIISETVYDYYFCSIKAPVISSPAISDSAITQDQSVIITCEVTSVTDHVIVAFQDSSGDLAYAVYADIDGTTATAVTLPNKIPVDVYAAGDIEIIAINKDGSTSLMRGDIDASLALTVTAAPGLPVGALTWFSQTVGIEPWSAANDFAEGSYGAKVNTACRIIQKTQKVIDAQGKVKVSHTEIHIDGTNTPTVKDRITLPDTTQPKILVIQDNADFDGSSMKKVIYT